MTIIKLKYPKKISPESCEQEMKSKEELTNHKKIETLLENNSDIIKTEEIKKNQFGLFPSDIKETNQEHEKSDH